MLETHEYDKIKIEVYKEIYAEAKIKFEDTIKGSELVTARAIKVLAFLFALSGWATSSFIGMAKKYCCIFPIYLILLIIAIYLLVKILDGRKSPLKGTMPRVIFDTKKDLMNPHDDTEKSFYFQQLHRYQDKIDRVEAINAKRGETLRLCVSISYILLLLTASLYALKNFS